MVSPLYTVLPKDTRPFRRFLPQMSLKTNNSSIFSTAYTYHFFPSLRHTPCERNLLPKHNHLFPPSLPTLPTARKSLTFIKSWCNVNACPTSCNFFLAILYLFMLEIWLCVPSVHPDNRVSIDRFLCFHPTTCRKAQTRWAATNTWKREKRHALYT